MGLKISIFWNTKDLSPKLTSLVLEWILLSRQITLIMLHSTLSLPGNEGDSRKMKKAEQIVQHFSG